VVKGRRGQGEVVGSNPSLYSPEHRYKNVFHEIINEQIEQNNKMQRKPFV